jgi:hypothetical protein
VDLTLPRFESLDFAGESAAPTSRSRQPDPPANYAAQAGAERSRAALLVRDCGCRELASAWRSVVDQNSALNSVSS